MISRVSPEILRRRSSGNAVILFLLLLIALLCWLAYRSGDPYEYHETAVSKKWTAYYVSLAEKCQGDARRLNRDEQAFLTRSTSGHNEEVMRFLYRNRKLFHDRISH